MLSKVCVVGRLEVGLRLLERDVDIQLWWRKGIHNEVVLQDQNRDRTRWWCATKQI